MCLLFWTIILLINIHQVPCANYFSVKDSKAQHCLNIIHPTNWQNAFEECQELGAEKSIIEVLSESEIGDFYNNLQEYNIYAFWTKFRKNYSSIIAGLEEDLISPAFPWSGSDKLKPNENCGLVTALPGDGGLKLRPAPCHNKHVSLCLAVPPRNYHRDGIFCANVINEGSEREPDLTLRSDGKELLLLFPESLSSDYFCKEEEGYSEPPGNPKCWLLGFRPWHHSSTVTLECYSKSELEYGVTKIKMRVVTSGEGYLTCQAWTTKSVRPIMSNTVLKQSYKYSQRHALLIESYCNDTVKICGDPEQAIESLAGTLNKKYFNTVRYIPAAVVSPPFSQKMKFVIHIIGELPDQIGYVIKNNTGFDVISQYNIQYCLKEQTFWQSTNATTRIIKADGTAFRMCNANFTFGAQWGPVIRLESSKQSLKSKALQDILQKAQKIATGSKIINLSSVMMNKTTDAEDILTADDTIIISLLLDSVDTHELNSSAVEAVAQVTAAVAKQEAKVLQVAQKSADSGNLILRNVDRILSEVDLHDTSDNKVLTVTSNFATLVFDVQTAGCKYHIRGLALLKTSDNQGIQKQDIVTITWDDAPNVLTSLEVHAAALLPLELLASLMGIPSEGYTEVELISQLNESCVTNKFSTVHKDRVVFSIFWNDTLFVQAENHKKLSTIIGVTINGHAHMDLDYPLILKYDSGDEYTQLSNTDGKDWKEKCVFWDLNSGGSWSHEGCLAVHKSYGSCACFHTTHFGELLRGIDYQQIKRPTHRKTLNWLSLLGSLLSFVGLAVIILTALIFPAWHHRGRAIIQLQLCVALCGLTTVLSVRTSEELMLHWDTQHGLTCVLSGIMLHIFLLASLLWMFVAGLHIRRRLINPFSDFSPQPITTKLWVLVLPCWMLPVALGGASLWASGGQYDPLECYPRGQALQFGVTVPAYTLIAANTLVLSLCIHATCSSSSKSLRLSNISQIQQRNRRQLIFSVYLAVLLGSGWIFGLMHMDEVFNLTASLQGFSIFLFAIVFDEKTRSLWKQMVCSKLNKRQSEIKLRLTLTSSILGFSTASSAQKSLSLKEDQSCTTKT